MIRKLLPILLALLGFLGGAAAGDILKSNSEGSAGTVVEAPAPGDNGEVEVNAESGAVAESHKATDPKNNNSGDTGELTWFKFPQQFFVPILHDGQLDSTMIISLSVEIPASINETVYARELKLRDALLRQLLIHANTGGFNGNFTSEPQLRRLRAELVSTAKAIVPEITDILIGDIARQDS